jgi:predicted DNA-binding WGR domain protein
MLSRVFPVNREIYRDFAGCRPCPKHEQVNFPIVSKSYRMQANLTALGTGNIRETQMAMKKQRYEYISENSLKFWEIEVYGAQLTTSYGRIGKTAQSTRKEFGGTQEAATAAKTLIKEKKRKGYVRVPLRPVYIVKKTQRREPSSSPARAPSEKFVNELTDAAGSQFDLEEKWLTERGFDRYAGDADLFEDVFDPVIHNPLVDDIWDKYQVHSTPDGVAWSDKAVPRELQRRLNYNFTRMLNQEPADFHPGSRRQVRDLVHPSLFPYVKGLSKTNPKQLEGLPVRLNCREEYTSYENPEDLNQFDFWKRPYEGSKFQWLPTPFEVNTNGAVKIQSYINNLDQDKYPSLYGCLEQLFSLALPLFESVCGYVDDLHLYADTYDDACYTISERELLKKMPAIRLRGRELQVITKIVEYQIDPRKGLEGVWHVEGMSHENILATAVYVLRRDETLHGGEIQFKREYTLSEATNTFWGMGQYPPDPFYSVVGKGVIPNGTLSTPEGRLFVFPNSHIHKLSKMTATCMRGTAKRRVIVFWLIHPDAPIISTREVPPQQKIIGKRKAKEIRLKLMNERKRHKQSLNPRAVSLCEH